MKNFELAPTFSALKKINLSLIKDKKIKDRLFELSLDLLAANRALQQKREDIRTVVLGPVQDSLDEIDKLRFKMNQETDEGKKKALLEEINSHKETLDPIYEFTQKADKLMQEDVEIKGLPRDSFMKVLSSLDGIDASVLEGLFPILE